MVSRPKKQEAPEGPQEASQGELSEALSVSEAVALVKGQVDKLPELVVIGEVTGFRGPNARSGHCYFQIKDASAAMDVTVWRWVYQKLGFELRDGLKVQMSGTFEVYDRRGSLSFHATGIKVAGEGLLRQQVAELARKLEREGLMDATRKRAIPRFCERVCVVTSLSGSVIDDVKRTLARRNPLVRLQAAGCTVQGEGAASSIIAALRIAAAVHPDAILLVRGGGSFEDLMTFNDERLARAVAVCPVPVITGIGHEPDTCICDMVADRRCSTPTAAAESVAPAIDEVESLMNERQQRLNQAMSALLASYEAQAETLRSSAVRSISFIIARHRQELGSLAAHRCLHDPMLIVRDRRASLELTAERLHGAMPRMIAAQRQATDSVTHRLRTVGEGLLRPYCQGVAHAASTLDALSPLRVLARGYAIVRDEAGHIVSSSRQLLVNEELDMRFGSGSARARVVRVEQGQGSSNSKTSVGASEG